MESRKLQLVVFSLGQGWVLVNGGCLVQGLRDLEDWD